MADVVASRGTAHRLSLQAGAAIAATVIAILPVLVVVATYAGRRYFPVGDYAVIDSRVRDVFSSDIPLLGMYSRFGWYHPGPAMFWALAPLSLLAGGAAWATLVGSALLQGLAVVWSARVAWRRGKLLLVLAVLVVQVLSYAGIEDFFPLQRPWNPFVAFPFLPLFILLVWSAGLGEVRDIPWVLLVGSFLVQTHSGYTVIVVAGVVWTACFVLRLLKVPELRGAWRRSAILSAIVLAVMWVAPVWQQLTHWSTGNIRRLAQFFVLGDVSKSFIPQYSNRAVGFPLAPQVFAAEFRWLPSWLGGSSVVGAYGPTNAGPVSLLYLLVPALLVIIGTVVSVRAHNRAAVHAVVLSGVLAVVGIFSLSRLRGDLTDFAFYWRISLSVVLVGAAVGALLTSFRFWQHHGVRVAVGSVLTIALIVPTFSLASKVADGDPELRTPGRVAASLARQLDHVPASAEPAMLLSSNAQVSTGVFDELNRRGRPVYVSSYFATRYFEGKHQSPTPVRSIWYLVDGADISLMAAMPQARELASVSSYSPANERRVRKLQATLAAQLTAAGRKDLVGSLASLIPGLRIGKLEGVDQDLLAELSRLQASLPPNAVRYAVFAFPPDQIPDGFHVPFQVI